MGFHQRKFLLEDKRLEDYKKYAECSDCNDCPEYCNMYSYLPPPPPPPPSPSPSPTSSRHHMSTLWILVICVLGAFFMFLSCLAIVRYRRLRNSRRRNSVQLENSVREDFIDENQGPVIDHHVWYIRTIGLEQSIIDSITVFKYKIGEGLIEGADCSVCLNGFQEDESLRLLPKCSHAFHVPCIDTWLRSHKHCPLCRAPVVSNTNTAQVNTDNTISNNLGSGEQDQTDGGLEAQEVETDVTNETRDGAENIGVTRVDEGNFVEIFQKSSFRLNGRGHKLRVLSDLADHHTKVDEELQPVRRSISLDLSSCSMIDNAVASIHVKKDEGCSNSKLAKVEEQNSDVIANRGNRNSSICRLIKSYSYGHSQQEGPIMIKRSFSFSWKHSLLKHRKSLDSIPISIRNISALHSPSSQTI